MSDEEEMPESIEKSAAPTDDAVPTETKEEATLETKQSLRNKFRLTKDEEILKTIKPSIFAFLPMYLLAVMILGVHLLFGYGEKFDDGDNGIVAEILFALLDLSEIGEIGFVVVMFLVTWFNRMMNGATSGKWSTILLLLITFTPVILRLDDFISWLITGDSEGWIGGPFDDFNYLIFGIMWSGAFALATMFYQRSFHYAITNHRVIFTQHMFIAGDGRRILFDNINEVRTQRTLLGAFFGYNTIITDTGSGLDLGEETMGVSGGVAPGGGGGDGSIEGKLTKSIFKRFFVFLTYQRSRKIDLPDPRHCFYCIYNWRSVEELLNEMHQRHSSSGMLTDLKEHLIAGNE